MENKNGKLRFVKMHGCGNDYVYVDCFDQKAEDPEKLAIVMSDRHFGIGGDGLVLICPSDTADVRMRMFNLDGSEGNMCGNAIRCVGKYMYDSGRARKENIAVDTKSGLRTLEMTVENGVAVGARVNMGKAAFSPKDIPVLLDGERNIARETKIAGGRYEITCVSMGNPHCVVFCEEPDDIELEKIGPLFEHADIFPERVNTEFVRVIDDHTLKMRVWERGSGETLACGTGACATVAAAVMRGFCPANEPVKVMLRGGELEITYTDEAVFMYGPATKVFEGELQI